jgi:hypothetical protein
MDPKSKIYYKRSNSLFGSPPLDFNQTPDLPESLVEGKEREYLSWFFKGLA